MRYATEVDYERRQGGRPKIHQEGRLWLITHHYRPDKPVVRTHNRPHGQVVALEVDGELVLFNPSELWEFEGAPCELESTRLGGEGYQRLSSRFQPRPREPN